MFRQKLVIKMEEQYKEMKHLIKEAGIDHPSSGFLQNVMNQIETSEVQKLSVYTPLISRKAWLVIGTAIVMLLLFMPFLSDSNESILNTMDFSFLNKISVENPFSDFKFHKTTIYGILFLAILFFIQIPMLKNRIDKNFPL